MHLNHVLTLYAELKTVYLNVFNSLQLHLLFITRVNYLC